MSIHCTHITIQNGNNAPSLFSRDISKRFTTTEEMAAYRRRVGLLAKRRYKKDHVTVFFNYKEVATNPINLNSTLGTAWKAGDSTEAYQVKPTNPL